MTPHDSHVHRVDLIVLLPSVIDLRFWEQSCTVHKSMNIGEYGEPGARLVTLVTPSCEGREASIRRLSCHYQASISQ